MVGVNRQDWGQPVSEKPKTNVNPITGKVNGGARPGSGRKPKANFEARELFKKAFDDNFLEEDWAKFIIDAKKDGKLLPYIIDQRIGKAAQAMDLTTNGKDLPAPIYGSLSLK